MLGGISDIRRALLPLAAAVLLAACTQGASLQPTTTGGDGVEKSFALLTDIPIPPSSTLDVEKSLVLGDLDRWTGRTILNFGQPPPAPFAPSQNPTTKTAALCGGAEG